MFFRFLIFSGLAAAVNLATGVLLYGYLGFNDSFGYAASVAIAFIAGMGVSFTLNRAYTYDSSGRPPQEELRDFFLVSLGGLALTTALAHLFLNGLRVQFTVMSLPVSLELAAHVMAVAVTAFYSFFAHKHFSFRRASAAGLPTAARNRT
ncbi:GtrA family protein [Alisedimentitalea sp. MJ-SS2]|uniref:GtrA family protein n=1 Tax=Aliisedimentitalea sp. MJ-SS2 TaxID=3049795 RepID=UPI00290CBDA7|nr:GtrA family protein [Alisedimentitalea sp. MJ-SS2]MDU8928285.1 GtrA family protein [Alisedimentitalea sp. MJ-SS2]